MQTPTAATPEGLSTSTVRNLRRFRVLVRLRHAGLSEAAIRTMLPEAWTRQAFSGRDPNTGNPR